MVNFSDQEYFSRCLNEGLLQATRGHSLWVLSSTSSVVDFLVLLSSSQMIALSQMAPKAL